jgi:hypothetical protein
MEAVAEHGLSDLSDLQVDEGVHQLLQRTTLQELSPDDGRPHAVSLASTLHHHRVGHLRLIEQRGEPGKPLTAYDPDLDLLSTQGDGVCRNHTGIRKVNVVDGQVGLRQALAQRQLDWRKVPRDRGVLVRRELSEDEIPGP